MLSPIKEIYYFNYHFISGTGFNLNEEIRCIFITKPKSQQCSVTLTFVMKKPLASDWANSEVLIIAQEFEEVLTYNKNIRLEYDCEYTTFLPNKTDILCCLFAWHGCYKSYVPMDFTCILKLEKETFLAKLRATLTQMLVNRIIPSTRMIRCLYDDKTQNIEFTFFYYGEEYEIQYQLIQEGINTLLKVSALTFSFQRVIAISFEGSLVGYTPLRKGEWALFCKYDALFS